MSINAYSFIIHCRFYERMKNDIENVDNFEYAA